MQNKTIYKTFCQNHDEIPIFSQYWWLDIVCGENNWDVALCKIENKIAGAFPYYIKKKIGLKFLILPKFTQKLGPFIVEKYKKDYFKITKELINNLPKFNYFDQDVEVHNNILPFYWEGFESSFSYSFRINNINNSETTYSNFHNNRKQDIKTGKKNNIKTYFDINTLQFFEFHKKNLNLRKTEISYKFEDFDKLFKKAKKNNKCVIAGTKKENEEFGSMAFIVWDKKNAYLNQLTTNIQKLKEGHSSILINDILYFMRDKVENFDFEGSMDNGIYNFYKSFGVEPVNLARIKKSKPIVLKDIINFFKITLKNKKC